eukprot:GEZU01029172.1.p1 GENE.GEZU01029172.1~~GEZU01029172.1.p1  ORF type:complete len:329 (-),score=113.98 GEZU01029172.1:176-1027(-)
MIDKPLQASLQALVDAINPPSTLPQNAIKQYALVLSKLNKVWPLFIDTIMSVGQAQLVRKHIASELNFSCKLDSNLLCNALDVMNKALLNDVKAHYQSPDTKPYPNENNPLLPELSKYLDTCGMSSPFEKIYITTEPIEFVPLVLFLFVIAQLPKFVHDPAIDSMVCKKKDDPLDGTPFVVGIITLLKQFHSSHKDLFLAYLGQYVRAQIDMVNVDTGASSIMTGVPNSNIPSKRELEIPADVKNVLHFLEDFCRYDVSKRTAVESHIPAYLFARFKQEWNDQ